MCRFDEMKMKELILEGRFQYISCVGSMLYLTQYRSKQLLFQYISCVGSIQRLLKYGKTARISIHLMCRFDLLRKCAHNGRLRISIHLMCRFDVCALAPLEYLAYFNTSHVSVRLA